MKSTSSRVEAQRAPDSGLQNPYTITVVVLACHVVARTVHATGY